LEDDRLGFSPVAEHLARAIVDQTAKDGLVFGIEGKWGSGKSTLINLTIDALRRHGDAAPEIVQFSPWLVGNRDDLLRHLFDELADAAVRIDPIDTNDSAHPDLSERVKRRFIGNKHFQLQRKEELKKNLGSKLRVFGSLAGGLAKIANASGAVGMPYADTIGTALERSGEAVSGLFTTTSVAKRKSEIVGALKLLSRRIVVFIDDLDRLEPREASEVLRLVRAVADFPNVIYVLSYDPDVVSKTLQTAVQVDDGAAFLEKIVQVSFRVPRPEAFDLRRWFQTEVRSLFPAEFGPAGDHPPLARERLMQAIDIQGGRYLKTPRDVVRALNALRLHAIPVRERIDISDMVWLQLVRIGNPALYAWVEEYVTEASAIHNGARATEEQARQMAARLEEIFNAEKLDVSRATIDMAELLPGITDALNRGRRDEGRKVFNNLGGNAVNSFIASRRLGSPQHYRYYFAFAEPAGALRDEQVQLFIDLAASQPGEALTMLAALAGEVRPQGGVMAEVLIDRVTAAAERVPAAAIPGIFAALAAVLDDVARSSQGADVGEWTAWGAAEEAVRRLLRQVPQGDREDCLRRLFEGRALGWLTDLLRGEIFSHGRYGEGAKSENQRLLTVAEFESVLMAMLRRFSETPPDDLMRVPNLMSLLYAWKQGSGTDDARRWVEAKTETDAGLLAFLYRARSWVASSSIGVYYPLKQRDLQNFLDYEDAVRRVGTIATSATASEADRKRAAELVVAFEQGRED